VRRILIPLAVMSLVFVGCGNDESAETVSSPAAQQTVGVPTLEITSPKDGDTITNPMKVTYQVTGFEVGAAPKGHFHAIWGTGPNDYAAFANATANSGTVTSDKNVPTDVTEVTFQLSNANHSLLTNPEAKVVVKNLKFGSSSSGGGTGY
jgi:hypothetical protein